MMNALVPCIHAARAPLKLFSTDHEILLFLNPSFLFQSQKTLFSSTTYLIYTLQSMILTLFEINQWLTVFCFYNSCPVFN